MNIDEAVEILTRSIERGIHDPPELKGRLSIDDGYRVQLAMLQRRLLAGERQVGWKVGLTAKAIQAQVKFHEPVFGYLLRSGQCHTGVTLDAASLRLPGFENELCLTIGAVLQGPGVSFEQARVAVSQVAPALEIIEKRQTPPLDMPLGMADNGQQKAFVTGKAVPYRGTDLAGVTVGVTVNGVACGQALGAEVLGAGPIASIAWLANKLAQFGRRLEPGDQVMAGSFTRQYDAAQGDLVRADFASIGVVEARFC